MIKKNSQKQKVNNSLMIIFFYVEDHDSCSEVVDSKQVILTLE